MLVLQNAGGALQHWALVVHAPPCGTHGRVVDVVAVVAVVDDVLVDTVVVVGATHRPLTASHELPGQHTVDGPHRSPGSVQHAHVGPVGSQRSNWTPH